MISVHRREATVQAPEEAYVEIDWGDGSPPSRATAYGPRKDGTCPRVSWSAFGRVTPRSALDYCGAIALAAAIAPTLSGPVLSVAEARALKESEK